MQCTLAGEETCRMMCCLWWAIGRPGGLPKLYFPVSCLVYNCLLLLLFLILGILCTCEFKSLAGSSLSHGSFFIDHVLFFQYLAFLGCFFISRFTYFSGIPMYMAFYAPLPNSLAVLCSERSDPRRQCSEKCCCAVIIYWVSHYYSSACFMIYLLPFLMHSFANVDSCY